MPGHPRDGLAALERGPEEEREVVGAGPGAAESRRSRYGEECHKVNKVNKINFVNFDAKLFKLL